MSWMKKPSKEEREICDYIIDRVRAGIELMYDKNTEKGESEIGEALEQLYGKMIKTDLISYRFKPILELWDFKVEIIFFIQQSSLGDGIPYKLYLSTEYTHPDKDAAQAEKICMDATHCALIAVRRFADLFVKSDMFDGLHNGMWWENVVEYGKDES